jgi:hypothetical protein
MTRTEAQRLVVLAEKLEAFAPSKGVHVGGGVHVRMLDTPSPGWTTAMVAPQERTEGSGDYTVPGIRDASVVDPIKRARLTRAEQDEMDALLAARVAAAEPERSR